MLIEEGKKSPPAGQYADLTPWLKNGYCEPLEEDEDDALKKRVIRKTKIGGIMIFWTAMVYDHIRGE